MRNFVAIFALLLLLGCEKATDQVTPSQYQNMLVVDATITDEKKEHEVKLSLTMSDPNAVPEPVTGAAVMVYDADTTWNLVERPEGSGQYYTPAFASPVVGNTYTLLISAGGVSYSAKATVTKPLEFARMRYKQTSEGLYKIYAVANPYNPNRPAMYEINFDWSFLPAYKDKNPDDCRATVFYYTLPTLDVSEILAPESEIVEFPAGTRVVERRYSLSDEQAEFIRALLLNTTWAGGLFNSAPATLPTNVSNGGAGFFGACGVNSRTFFVWPGMASEE